MNVPHPAQWALSLLPQALAQRLPLLVIASFLMGGLVATWTSYNLFERRAALHSAETSGGELQQIIQAAHFVDTQQDTPPYLWSKTTGFAADSDAHTVPLILTLGAVRYRAAVVFDQRPKRPDLLRAGAVSQSASDRLGELSKGISRQDGKATLVLFLRDGEALTITAPDLWRDRLGETTVALIGIAAFIGVIMAILPLALNLAAPFQTLTSKNREPLTSLASSEAQMARDHIVRLKERFAIEQDKRVRGLAAISHDLRTPVTRLRLRTEFLPEDITRDKFTADLDEISSIVDGALDLLSIRHQAETSHRFSLAALLESLVDDYRDTGRDVSFHWPEALDLPSVPSIFGHSGHVTIRASGESMMRGQPDKLRRALSNLIDNGLKYGGEVTVSIASPKADLLQVEVRDHGPGIAADRLESVLMPFVRGHGHGAGDGVGLGLSITHEIAELHGGELTLEDAKPGLRAILRVKRGLS
ncbi:HAMP domain-containing histidine kinase [Parasedimentitalea maritima]|uniref:histidine kinase n=1 Tax=Parasedimentitalea maritima TaxID=2578117 RepID=A0ABY2UY45_9RHOB|nr:HAMP domain-containing sensor histidine kinase [Zongyanglinia marina]TLP61358.1 HAMP domain-containing histidine kinase [Zongyanglinia marina]